MKARLHGYGRLVLAQNYGNGGAGSGDAQRTTRLMEYGGKVQPLRGGIFGHEGGVGRENSAA